MSNLVSRNPVQRFKEGQKIVKAWGGANTDEFGLNTPYISRGNRLKSWFSNLFNSPQQTRIGMNGKPIVDTVVSKTTSKPQTTNTKSTVAPRQKDYSFMKVGTRQRTSDEIQKLQDPKIQVYLNRQAEQGFTAKPISKIRKPYFFKQYVNRSNEIGGVNNIKAWQRKLGVKADGIWGRNTENAYNAYIQQQQSLQNITSGEDIMSQVDRQTPYDIISANRNQPTLNKQGGQLVSRNPVQRFKSKYGGQPNFRQVAQ